MAQIDVTITATLRAEILERTLCSFVGQALEGHDYRLIVNVDPVGTDEGPGAVALVLRQFWTEGSVLRIPNMAHFGRAFHWTWSQVRAPYVLHLEDDWELLRAFSIDRVTEILDGSPSLALLRLPWQRTYEACYKSWNCPFPWNGSYFVCPSEMRGLHGFCGHPSIIKREFVRVFYPVLDPERNPEKQIKSSDQARADLIERFSYGVFGEPNSPPLIRDIGRAWRNQNHIVKAGHDPLFTRWEIKHGPNK